MYEQKRYGFDTFKLQLAYSPWPWCIWTMSKTTGKNTNRYCYRSTVLC